MNKSESIDQLALALAKAQGELKPAKMNKNNPFFKSKYADLESVWDSIRLSFSKNGLSITQTIHTDEGGHSALLTHLLHSSGQWITSAMPLHPEKLTPQGLGSAITYARRYALSAIAGVCSDEDDDGNLAETKPKEDKKSEPKQDNYKDMQHSSSLITEPQRKRLFAIANKHGWNESMIKEQIQDLYGITSTKDLNKHNYDDLISKIEFSRK